MIKSLAPTSYDSRSAEPEPELTNGDREATGRKSAKQIPGLGAVVQGEERQILDSGAVVEDQKREID